jgi:hypothetical protein
MRTARFILVAALLCRAGDDVQHKLAGRAFGDTPLLQDLHELCDGIGGRPAGSPACERAIALVSSRERKTLDDLFAEYMKSVPNLAANQDATPYLPQYHAESDTVDRVNARELRANTALASSLAWWLADAPERFGRRLSRNEVKKLLIATKLDAQMKAFAQWDDFESGKRGVNK